LHILRISFGTHEGGVLAATYSTLEVAKLAGVHKDTLLRWLRRGWVAEPRRDFRRWRVFNRDEAMAIAAFARRLRDPEGKSFGDPRQLALIPDAEER
jgi:DNA-binding transcriptional MerR regulator